MKKAAELLQVEEVVEIVLGPEQVQQITTQENAVESNKNDSNNIEESLGNHEWLVE